MQKESRFMLDTNTASYIIRGEPQTIRDRLIQVPMAHVYISSITQAELLRGVAKKPESKRLAMAVNDFLLRVEILAWDSLAAKTYANLRTTCEKEGKSLGNMDMLIAAHSKSKNLVLVTNDQAFFKIKHHLLLEDWTESVNES